ncbi:MULTISPECIES: ParA family protein [Methylococcus]|uniref:ArsA/GET3 Anion-transporting ATPase-like domain-containing protein n=1 Tax=Methylococcus capsulatus TaxID=414 RepID=A0ABZ2F5N4_METCP|nr:MULTISPECIES: ArsA-related P-loop ATPase [Methylococcus]MDF9393433.1 ParA family protein [Methylococcus capsulatus]
MTTFDQIVPAASEVLEAHRAQVEQLPWLVINRDLNGRVRFIVPERIEADDDARRQVEMLYQTLATRISPHAHPAESGILYEASRDEVCLGAASYPLEGFDNVWVVDRLATEGNWANIAPETEGAPRIVFFSIKGGVGRSTALAACAWKLAQLGKRLLVLDLDLESPGLSSSLLPQERQPMHGITDWLVEDLVDNADGVLDGMVATSGLSHDGEIHVVPAHGKNAGEYIAKLGRVWMPKVRSDGSRESWSARLQRLLQALEARIQPDIVLIDSRAGIDEVASSCVTDLGANMVLLFALDGSQTWSGYRILFDHWQRARVAECIRERLQIVAALVPELDPSAYLTDLRERAYDLFLETLYDEIPPADAEGWSFDLANELAPHMPWGVRWHRGFAALRTLHGRLAQIDDDEVRHVFGDLIGRIVRSLGWGDGYPKVIDGGVF